jgi:hypothetical protein
VVESDGLENRCALTGTVGSNPTLSATVDFGFRILDFGFIKSAICNPKSKIGKGAGVVELAALEML